MAAVRNAARHRPAVDSLLRSTDISAALVRPAPAARRQLCDSAVAKIAGLEVERVEAAAAARYDATGRSMQELTAKVKGLTATLSMKETDAAMDLTRTATKVCGLVSVSAAALAGLSYLVIKPTGGSAPPDATKQVEQGMEEIKTRLEGKISEWYEDEEAKARAKAVSKPASGSISKLKSISISKPKSVPVSSPVSNPVSGSSLGSGSSPVSGSSLGSGSSPISGSSPVPGSSPSSGSSSISAPISVSGPVSRS